MSPILQPMRSTTANLQSVTIPESVTSIGNSAFSNCTSLAAVTIPENVTHISGSAFSNCTALKHFTSRTASQRDRHLGIFRLPSLTE
ncbi:MAG: leucine-rich repeat domain-containing protein [Ruminococcus callidus]